MTKRKILIISLSIITAIILLGLGLGIAYLASRNKTVRFSFNDSKTFQTFEGFGASSAWNFRVLGRDFPEEVQDEAISLLYGQDGLSLEIFRYNLGGGSCEVNNCTYPDDRKTESFFNTDKYINYSSFANELNYDFTKDSSYVSMMLKSFEIGNIKKLVIFSNSPHYLLTKNGKTNASTPLENNLKEDAYEAFSDYVLICSNNIKKMLNDKGFNDIEIYLSPVNEPQWNWGGDYEIQEGCHYGPEELAKFYDTFHKKMTHFNRLNNTNFILDIYESGSYIMTDKSANNKKYFEEFSKYDFYKDVEVLSMHSYCSDSSIYQRVKFQNYLQSKGIEKKTAISEYCVMEHGVDQSVEMGLKSSKVVMRDLIYNNATEWTWWLGLAYGGYEDGLVYLDKNTNEISLTYRYYMFKTIMDNITPGDTRIKTNYLNQFDKIELDTVAFKKQDGSVVIVVLNDSDKDKVLKCAKLKNYENIVAISTSEDGKLVEEKVEKSNTLNVKSNSITAFICK